MGHRRVYSVSTQWPAPLRPNMRPIRVLLFTVCLLLAVPLVAQSADVYAQWLRDNAATAEWCLEKGLVDETKRAAETLLALNPPADVRHSTDTLLKKAESAKASEPDAGLWAELLEREAGAKRKASEGYAKLAEAAEGEQRDKLYKRALEFDHHNAAARAHLGQLEIEGFGWFAKDEHARLTARAMNADDAKADAQLAKGDGPLLLQTAHFTLLSDLTPTQTRSAGKHVELLWKAFREQFGSVIPECKRRAGVRLFRDKKAYTAEVERIGQPASFAETAGFFAHWPGVVYYCDANAKRTGGVNRTLSHECTHQLITIGLCGDPLMSTRSFTVMGGQACTFIVEGSATYMEPVADKQGYGLGSVDQYREWQINTKSEQAKLDKLDEFVALTSADWNAKTSEDTTRRYAQGALLVAFCLHGERAEWRAAMLRTIQRYYRGCSSVDDFKAALGCEWTEFETAWQDFLKTKLMKKK